MVRMVQYNTKNNNKKGRFRDTDWPRGEGGVIGIGKIGYDGTP